MALAFAFVTAFTAVVAHAFATVVVALAFATVVVALAFATVVVALVCAAAPVRRTTGVPVAFAVLRATVPPSTVIIIHVPQVAVVGVAVVARSVCVEGR